MTTAAIAYTRGPVERIGRKMKMEYVGMASVFAIIGLLILGALPTVGQQVAGVGAFFFLFLGLKKKTRDHLSASLLLFGAAGFARQPLLESSWAVPLLLFGLTVACMEGYLERRQERIYLLPIVFLIWGLVDPLWPVGLAYVVLYLTHVHEDPKLRSRLLWLSLGALVTGGAAATWRGNLPLPLPARIPLSGGEGILLAIVGIVVLAVAVVYWRRLFSPRRLAALLFLLLAPWDVRLLAMFGLVAAVLLSATIFRQSIDSERLRPFFKHAEWHFFWWVLAIALWAAYSA